MTRRVFDCILVLGIAVAGCGRRGGDQTLAASLHGPFPSHHVANTEVRPLPRAANGRVYQLHIGFPDSFADDPQRRYPVIYLCDAYWDFALVQSIVGGLVSDQAIPEAIVVGLGYAPGSVGERADVGRLRRWDLTPVPATYEGAAYDGPSGHAGEFLALIEQQVMPLVEREYRGDPGYRVLMGSSLGGLFTLYAMLARPGLFTAYVAASPIVQWADDWLLQFEAAFRKGGQPLGARLFVSGAEKEIPAIVEAAKRFDNRMREHAYPGLAYEFRIIAGEGHTSTKPESYNRGLRFALSPHAPTPAPFGP
jgi:predicted alpha/beta superfamily hydrolase